MKTTLQTSSLLSAAMALIVAAGIGYPVSPASAVIISWDNGGNNNLWSNGSNWNRGDNVPGSADIAHFYDYFISEDMYVELGGSQTVLGLTFEGEYDYTIDHSVNTDTLTLAGGDITTSGTATHSIYNDIVLGSYADWDINNTLFRVIGNISTTDDNYFLYKTGSGTLALYGNNTLNELSLDGGTLLLGSNTAVGTGAITVSDSDSDQTIVFANGVTISNEIDVLNELTLYVASGENATHSGLISSSDTDNLAKIIYEGQGTLTLTGGTNSIPSSIARLSATKGGHLILDGTHLDLTRDDDSLNSALAIYNGEVTMQNGANVNIENSLGTVDKGATLTLKGDGTTLSTQRLDLGAYDYSDGGQLVVEDNAHIETSELIAGFQSDGNAIVQNGGTINTTYIFAGLFDGINGDITVTGADSRIDANVMNLGGQQSLLSGGIGTVNVTDSGVFNVQTITRIWSEASSITVDGGTFETGGLTGEGTVNISGGDNAFTVGTNNSSTTFDGLFKDIGGLIHDVGYEFGRVTKTGSGTFTLTGGRADNLSEIGILSSEGGTIVLDGAYLDLQSTDDGTKSALLLDGGDVILQNGAVAELSLYHGHAQIQNGTLTVTGADSQLSANSTVLQSNGSLVLSDGGALETARLTGNGMVNFSGDSTLTVGLLNNSSTFDGQIQETTSGSGTLTKTGTGNFTLTGGTTTDPLSFGSIFSENGSVILDGARINLTSTDSVNQASLRAIGGDITLRNGADVQISRSWIQDGTLTIAGNNTSLSGVGLTVLNENSSLVVEDNATLDLTDQLIVGLAGDGNLTVQSGANVTTGSFNINGSDAGLVTGSGSQLTTGWLDLAGSDNSTLTVNDDGLVEVTGTTHLWSNGIGLAINGGTFKTDKLTSYAGAAEASVNLSDSGELVVGTNNSDFSYYGQILDSDGSGTLTKTGTGTFTVTGIIADAHLTLGNLFVENGTIAVDEASVIEADQLTGTGTVSISGTNALTVGINNGSSTFDGLIQDTNGTGTLTKTGSGTFTMTGGTVDNPLAFATLLSNDGTAVLDGAHAELINLKAVGGEIALQNGAVVQLDADSSNGWIQDGLLKVSGNETSLTGTTMKVMATDSEDGLLVEDNATLSLTHDLLIGHYSRGHMKIQSGGVVSANQVTLNGDPDDNPATSTITGIGSKLSANQLLLEGYYAIANVDQGGEVDITGATQLVTYYGAQLNIDGGIFNSGSLDLGGLNTVETRGPGTLTLLNNGTAQVAGQTGLWTAASSININDGMYSTDQLTGRGKVYFSGDGALTVGINNGSSTFSGLIQEAAGGASTLTKTGTGTFTLTGGTDDAPSIFSALQSESGTVVVDGAHINLISTETGLQSALTANGGDITLQNGANVQLNNEDPTELVRGFVFDGNTLTVTGSETSLTGSRIAVQSSGSSLIAEDNATIVLTNSLTIDREAYLAIQSGASVSGDFVEIKDFSSGLITGSNSQLSTETTYLGRHGILTVQDGGAVQTDQLTGSGTFNISGNDSLAVGINNGSSTFGGLIQDMLGGSGRLTKTGSGTFTLTGDNTFTGGTWVRGGTLLANTTTGSATGSGDILLFDGTTLGGKGSIESEAIMFMGSTLAPGESAGQLTVGSVTFHNGSVLDVELGGLLAGNEYDVLSVLGDATFFGSSSLLEVSLIDRFELDYNQQFGIMDIGGLLDGQFANLSEGALVNTFNGIDLFITYQAGDGNDIALYTAAVPEPASLALLGLAGLALILHDNRRTAHLTRSA
ncbi:beta strand repeat-containing protein [Poriferisphaera sp. WC338]|uniref:beta strand repeat-containing protein n=1 Tax=Poriferisphaera sp. WC338 TaxID=3425129 RepID=UPI003D814F5D